jgi:hypothetical protein
MEECCDDDDGDERGEFGGVTLGGGYTSTDFTSLALKPDHYNRPLWVCSDGRVFLETYSPIYKQVWRCCVRSRCGVLLRSSVPATARAASTLTPHTSHLTPHTSHLTHHT